LGKKSASFSRFNCAMFVQEFIISFKRRLFLMLMFIMLVTIMFYGYIEFIYIITKFYVIFALRLVFYFLRLIILLFILFRFTVILKL